MRRKVGQDGEEALEHGWVEVPARAFRASVSTASVFGMAGL
jgi:hypothetical protein